MRVLIIDDDAQMMEIMKVSLTKRGHDVEVMTSAFGAKNRIAGRQGDRPDVVILDFMMPALSGEQLLALLSDDSSTVGVPVVIYSAADVVRIDTIAKSHPHCVAVQKGSVSLLEFIQIVELLAKRHAAVEQ